MQTRYLLKQSWRRFLDRYFPDFAAGGGGGFGGVSGGNGGGGVHIQMRDFGNRKCSETCVTQIGAYSTVGGGSR